MSTTDAHAARGPRLAHVVFSIVAVALAAACAPSVLGWLLWTFLAFTRVEKPADWAFLLLALPAGWWGWLALACATGSSIVSPAKPWPRWVKLGLLAGSVTLGALWAFMIGLKGIPRSDSIVNGAFAIAVFGGAALALTLLLLARAWLEKGSTAWTPRT